LFTNNYKHIFKLNKLLIKFLKKSIGYKKAVQAIFEKKDELLFLN
jgi:hypothetical protein